MKDSGTLVPVSSEWDKEKSWRDAFGNEEDLAVLLACVFEAVTEQMHDARLQGGRWKCGSQGVWNTVEAIRDGDHDVGDSAGLEVLEDLQPEFCSLGVLDPYPRAAIESRRSR